MFRINKNRCLITILVLTAVFCFNYLGCSQINVEKYYESGLVTAAPIATEVGKQVLASGGNAFDAAVAVGFAMAVVHPNAGNIGGGGFALIRDGSSGEMTSLDFRETAPLGAFEKMYQDDKGNIINDQSLIGAKAVGVPGTVAGLYELWSQKGSMAWEQLVSYAASLADTGFIIDSYLARRFDLNQQGLNQFNQSSQIFSNNSSKLKEGDRLLQKNLAKAFYLIATDGVDGFYRGEIADSLVQTMIDHEGIITHDDLENYRPVWREPVSFSFDSLEVYSMAPPSSGGIVMAQILKILEPFGFSKLHPNQPEYINLFTEASRLAFADRSEYLGDPEFYNVPMRELLAESYIDERRSMIIPKSATQFDQFKPGIIPTNESDQTTHFSVYDKNGNIVSLTYTLNTDFGSKLMVNGFGILLNNEMDDFSVKPGEQNTYGLIGGEANKIEAGKRMLSSMSPTIVLKNDQPFLVIGTPGGSKIITVVTQAIINFTRFNLSPKETVSHPRFHHQWIPDILYLEENGFDINVKQELIRYGYTIKERGQYSDLQLLYIDPSGLVTGESDPRNRGNFDGI
jgi:gamma-glutamyltranspeptidase/glutathione hydrolase